ncbi:hypothetical protein POM88_023434 [Heracleum sosnowskyi]|uniref:RRM domain-containing protein n=1 Tax=Heracleum sosnowskyi TaxID=360622 RepID=A0AAD8MUL7_9APIA|nr:hypothetical protein POM88_023434 [Heracleum sosnowskyi]
MISGVIFLYPFGCTLTTVVLFLIFVDSRGRTLLVTRIPLEAKEEDVYSVFENRTSSQPGNADHDAYVTFRTVAECEAALYSGGRTLLVTRIPLKAKEDDVYSVFENEDIFVDLQPENADHDAYVTFRTVAECEAALYSGDNKNIMGTRVYLEETHDDYEVPSYSGFKAQDSNGAYWDRTGDHCMDHLDKTDSSDEKNRR